MRRFIWLSILLVAALPLLVAAPVRGDTPDSTRASTPEVPPFRIELLEPENDSADRRGREDRGWPWKEDGEDTWHVFSPEWRGVRDHSVLARTSLGSALRYNRVEGLAGAVHLERGLEESYLPAYQVGLGYAFAAQRSTYSLGLEQPVAPRGKVTLGVAAYRRFDAFFLGDEIITSAENSLSALFFHRDYRDWFEAEGVRAWIGGYPSDFVTASLGIVAQDERSLGLEADWSVFRQTSRFRPNPDIAEGRYRAYLGTLTYDGTRGKRCTWHRLEHRHRLQWERSDASLDSDFDSWRVFVDSRTYLALSASQAVALRLLAGSGSASLSPQRAFSVGGIGTLRGHDFKSLTGTRLAVASFQYEFEVMGPSRALAFVDAGTAWSEGTLGDQRIGVDAGAGIRFGEDGMTFMLARTVNEDDSDVKVLVRFQSTF